jgi:hypothetical protein
MFILTVAWSVSGSGRLLWPPSLTGSYIVPAGIHKIKHVVIVEQRRVQPVGPSFL